MDIAVLYKRARTRIEHTLGTYRLFQVDDRVENFCLNEFLRLIEQDTRCPRYRRDFDSLPRWQQLACFECMSVFIGQLDRLKAERLASR